MNKVTINYGTNKPITMDKGCTPFEVLQTLGVYNDEIVGAKINNVICSLVYPIKYNAEIEPIYLNTKEGSQIYRRTLCFVLAAACHKLFPDSRLLVGHSLGHGYYYTFERKKDIEHKPHLVIGVNGGSYYKLTDDVEINNKELKDLENQMKSLIKQNIPITIDQISYKDAISLFEKLNLHETQKQIRYICPPSFNVNTLDDFSDLYFGPLLHTTGQIKTFELMKYGHGFLLRFPNSSDHSKLSTFEDTPKLFNIYSEYKKWGKQLGVTSAASLNELVHLNMTKDLIDITESLQTKHIADIADQIKSRGNVKVVLIAGPSSSGKTTTSKKLTIQLRVLGYIPKVIELDTYYVGRDQTPKDKNGNYDYECLEALDVKQLNSDLLALFNRETIQLPSYDFVEGKRYFSGKTMNLNPKDILILEGIHGLNDNLTPLIPSESKFKIYLSALTQINLDDHNRISTSDNRLIRRIVRDSKFRGKSAAETIKMWPSVQNGERLHIFPFQNNADAMLNTALDYELSVLKVYAEPLLKRVSPFEKEYAEASRLLGFLNNFLPIPVTDVPGQSIIREFVGNSDFKY